MQLIVLGMHRSGTSVMGQLLEAMGFYFAPKALAMPAQADNPNGFWERWDVVELNDSALAQTGSPWFAPGNWSPEALSEGFLRTFHRKAEETVAELNAHQPWFVKDPRMCLTLPLWKQHFTCPLYIIVHRHPLEIAQSLAKRNGAPLSTMLALCERHLGDALNFTLGEKRMFVSYSELLSSPEAVLRQLCSFLQSHGVSVPKPLTADDLSKLIDTRLRHHRKDQLDLSALTPSQAELTSRFEDASIAQQQTPVDLSQANSTLKAFDSAMQTGDVERIVATVKMPDTGHLSVPPRETLLERLETAIRKGAELETRLALIGFTLGRFSDELWKREKLAEAVADNISLFGPHLKLLYDRKGGLHDREFEVKQLQNALVKKEKTIAELREYCRTLSKGIPFTSKFRKAKRNFKNWNGQYKPEKIKPVPSLEKLSAELELKREKGVAMVQKIENAEHQLRDLLAALQTAEADIKQMRLLAMGAKEKPPAKPQEDRTVEPLVSIIIPVFNQIDYTLRCLQSLSAAQEKTPYEVIVVDDCSDYETHEKLKAAPGIRLIRNETNLGFVQSCNLGANAAKGAYLVFLNNDTKVMPGWLDKLVETFEQHPEAGLVGSKLVYPDGTLQEAGGIIWKDASGANYGRNDDPDKPEYNYFRETDYCSGASVMVRKDLFDHLRGFDTIFVPAYYEDTDLAFRIRKTGYKVYYQPQSVVVHFEGKSNGTSVESGVKQFQAVNRQKFYQRWQTVLDASHYEPKTGVFHARDRSAQKKLMVVIDRTVPEPDRNAGARSTFHYIQLFCKLGFNVKLIGARFESPQPYTPALEAMGVEVLHGARYAESIESWFQEHAASVDYVFVNRTQVAMKFLPMLKQLQRAKIFFYGHDLGSLRHQRHFELTGDAEAKERADQEAAQEEQIWQASNVILYPSTVETDYVKKLMPEADARTLPLYVLKAQNQSYAYNFHHRKDLLFIGGFDHQPNQDAVLWFVEHCWPSISEAVPEVRFRIIGSKVPLSIERLANERVIVTGWVDDEALAAAYSQTRLVVIPLRFGAGVKGKLVEAIHHNVPAVVTSIAAEGLPKIGALFPVADDAADFAKAVIQLYTAPDKLVDIASRCNRYIDEHFSETCALNALHLA